MSALEGLEPKALWRYFDLVSSVPRCSGSEDKIRARLVELARDRGIEVREDTVGNLVLCVPAAAGYESSPTVVLQGHLDMVCEQNSDSRHDFDKDGISISRGGDWLTADGTTLGADNGIAVAAALALLDDPPARHGPLELLFTVDEERGLSGASGIEPQMLEGRLLINMDSEEEGVATVGCAGGGDTVVELPIARAPLPAGWEIVSLGLGGMRGGHSGLDIGKNRANALRCLGRLLDRLRRERGGLRLLSLRGGSKRNAIPREAVAVAALAPGDRGAVEIGRQLASELRAELAADPELSVAVEPATETPGEAFTASVTERSIALLLGTPSGVLAMHREIPALVETSTNLGVVTEEGDRLRYVSCTRSSLGPALEAVREGLRALAEALGARVTLDEAYPGWNPNLDSELLAVFKRVCSEQAGKEPAVAVMHAGLECGILGERFPGMDMISFGPTMEDVHSPDERLSVSSSRRFYELLKALLEALA